MIVAVDIDDVIISLVPTWLHLYNKDYKDNLSKNDITDWQIDKFVKPECGINIYNYIEDPRIYDLCKPVENSFEAISILHKQARVIFITSSTIGCAGRKYVWLKKHGYIDKLDDYIEAKDKYLINYDCLIDDNYANIVHSNKNNYLFSAPWNLKYNYPKRINSWREFIDERNKFK